MDTRKKKGGKFRGFNKSNLLNWLILLEKNGYVMCSFKNCNFMAFDIEGMADHYSRCNSDKSNIKFNCEYCSGGIDSEDNLLKHKVLHHPQHANYKDFSDFNDKESSLFPSSFADKEVSYVIKKSWQVFLETRRYIKCLVQTCLYVANTMEQMATHYSNYCTPHYRDQLTYTCLTCKGRTDNLSDLKTHCKAAHPADKTETNTISSPIMHLWSELLREFNWAKCFNPNCNFIECDISTLKAHYSKCINPSKIGFVECSKCRGWLNGFTRLRKHVKLAHNPYNPRPIVYMVPVKLVNEKVVPVSDAEVKRALAFDPNSRMCEDLFRIIQCVANSNTSIGNGNSASKEKEENHANSSEQLDDPNDEDPQEFGSTSNEDYSICRKHNNEINDNVIYNCDDDGDLSTRLSQDGLQTDFCDTSPKGEKFKDQSQTSTKESRSTASLGKIHNRGQSSLQTNVNDRKTINSSKSDAEDIPASINQIKETREASGSDASLDGYQPPLKVSNMKTYSHNMAASKKLPQLYTAYIPKTTSEIDCTKALRGQVTFPKDLMDTNKWKLELPHVSLRSRTATTTKKTEPVPKVTSTLSKIAQEMAGRKGPLVPVSIKVNEMDTSWTVHVPSMNLKKDSQQKTVEKKKSDKVVEGKTKFKEIYWDNIQADMMELLNISVKNSAIRNKVRYHRHKMRYNSVKDDEDPVGEIGNCLFEYDSTNQEELAEDPRKDLGLTSDKDSDCDDLFIDEPLDFNVLPEEFDSLGPKTSLGENKKLLRGSWCVRLVERPVVGKDKDKNKSKEENNSNTNIENISSEEISKSVNKETEKVKEYGTSTNVENKSLEEIPKSISNEIENLKVNSKNTNVENKSLEEISKSTGNETEKESLSENFTSLPSEESSKSVNTKLSPYFTSKSKLSSCKSNNPVKEKSVTHINNLHLISKGNKISGSDSCNDLVLDLSTENHNKNQDNIKNAGTISETTLSKETVEGLSEINPSNENHKVVVGSSLIVHIRNDFSTDGKALKESKETPSAEGRKTIPQCLDLSLKNCHQETAVNVKQSSVCSDGIHCGTDDESVDSPPPVNYCESSDEEKHREGDSKPNLDSTDSRRSVEPISKGSTAGESESSPNLVIKKESIDSNFAVNHEKASNSSLENINNTRSYKRKLSNTGSENVETPKVKHVRFSDTLIIPDRIDNANFNALENLSPVETTTKRKCGRPRKKPVDNSTPLSSPGGEHWPPRSGRETSTPTRRPSRRSTLRVKTSINNTNQSSDSFSLKDCSTVSSVSDNLIIPDQDFSSIDDSSPVPSGIINMDVSTTDQDEPSVQRLRRPKNKRSTDIMTSLGERITPNSPLATPKKKVTCAVCSESMTAKEYQSKHLMKHNFLCWLVDEMPLPLDDFNTMVLVANRGKRAYPEHIYKCEKCKRTCKSSSGYLCHIRFCGKSKDEADSLMVSCALCNRLFKPNCIDQHMRLAHSKNNLTPEQVDVLNSPTSTRSTTNNSKKKISEIIGILSSQEDFDKVFKPTTPEKVEPANRVITKKLLKSWKEADIKGSPLFCPITNCNFRCNCYDTIQSHYRACNPLDPSQQVFLCKQCNYQTNFKDTYLNHMKDEHCLLVHLPENIAHYPINFLKELENDMYCSFTWVRCTTVFKPCLQLTREMRDKYLSKETLFPDLLVAWECWRSLEDDNPAYQPDYHTSPAIRYNSTSEWLRLPCYSAASFKGESLLWTGGCIHSMAWCPTPPNLITDQYLAVSCLLNFNQVFMIGKTYKQPTTVQLWNYGTLPNSNCLDSNTELVKTPMLAYALCINEGPVWDMEWCSSGCYDLRRLGLLACATASGSVNIYALPHPNQLNIPPERCPLFNGVPTLRLMFSRTQSFQCQKISWSKVKPHKLIAGGFVNGFVALWDLNVSSTFLREGSVLYPCRLFQAHHSTVTCLKMSPVDSSYLITGSLDKSIKLWDVRDVAYPIHSMVRGGVTDLDWLTHWLGFSFGMDAGVTPSPSSAFFSSIRDFSFIPSPLIGHSTASVQSISGSDWLNCLATGYDDGNVILTSCLRQFGDGTDAKKKIAKFILRTELVDLAKEKTAKSKDKNGINNVPDDSSSYEDTINLFGISISSSKPIEDKGKIDSIEEPRNDVYPIHSVAKVCFNPNQHSFLTLAVGFESGFVSALQLVPSRQVYPDIKTLCTEDAADLSEDYKL